MAGFVLPIISGLAGLLGNRGQKQTSTTDSTTTGSQSGTTSTLANFSPLQRALIERFTGAAEDIYSDNTNLRPYAANQMQAIGGQGNQNRQVISNILASRGLSYSPAAATPLTQNLLNTGNQQSQFLSSLPLLQRQLQTQGFDSLLRAFGALPIDQTSNTSGTSTQRTQGTGTQTTPGNPLAGLFSGVGAALPLAFPNVFGGGQQKPSGGGGGGGGGYSYGEDINM